MFHSFVAFLATVYNATPLAPATLHPTDNFTMANSIASSSSSSPTNDNSNDNDNDNNSNNTTTSYRPSSPNPLTEPILNARRRLLLSTTSTPSTPTLIRHSPWTPDLSRSTRYTPPRDEQVVLTDENWLPNRRFVRGDRMERAGPQDNLMLLAAEQAEQDAERALQQATTEQERRIPQLQREESYFQVLEYPSSATTTIATPSTTHSNNNNNTTNNNGNTITTLPYQQQQQQVQQQQVQQIQQQQQQRITTIAITPHLESFITDATYVPSVNISSSSSSTSSGSDDEQFVLQLPVRDVRLAGQSVAEWAGSRKTTKQRYAGSKRSCKYK